VFSSPGIKRSLLPGFVLLLCFLSPASAEEGGLVTNAEGGIFTAPRRLWFSVAPGEELIVTLNGKERYRGPGPAALELDVPAGTDGSFELRAERFSLFPEFRLLESRSFAIFIDKKPPPAPLLDAPPEGAWMRGPVTIDAVPPEGESPVTLVVRARLVYESGKTEEKSWKGKGFLESEEGEYAEARIEAFLEDGAGNRSAFSVRNFILDPLTVYAAPERTGMGEGMESGGRDLPFRSLERALEFARRQGRRHIRMHGSFDLQRIPAIDGEIHIDGGFNERWERDGSKSRIAAAEGAFLAVGRGGKCYLAGLEIEWPGSGRPFADLEEGAFLEIAESKINHGGILLYSEGGTCRIVNSVIYSRMGGGGRNAVFRVNGGTVSIEGSGCRLEAGNGLFLQSRGGTLRFGESRIELDCRRTGTALELEGTRGEFDVLALSVTAGDYGSCLTALDSGLVIRGGSLTAAARDVTAAALNDTSAVFREVLFSVDASFVARALDLRDRFPQVTDCRFEYRGNARRREIFSAKRSGGDAPVLPDTRSIGGNEFGSFTHIMGNDYPAESIQGFNRRFAPPERPNRFAPPPQALSPPQSGTRTFETPRNRDLRH
jgi:hypothetical protein